MKKLLSILTALVMVLLVPAGSMAATGFKENIYNYKSLEEMAFHDSSTALKNNRPFSSVIVVNSNSLDSDGLSASGLIGAADGLICTIDNNYSHEKLDKLLNGDTSKKIYFIGGTQVIPEGFKFGYGKQGYDCVTLAGRTRVETSYEVAKEIEKLTDVEEIALTNAFKGVPDSVSIAYTAYLKSMPVILTRGKSVPFSTNGIKTYAIGGPAVLSDSLIKDTNAVRLGGKNRYETNKKIINYFGWDKGEYSLCYGDSKGDNMRIATLAGCLLYARPVVLISENSDKSVLNGAKYIEYYGINNYPNGRLRVACYNATFGTGVTNASNTAYKVSRANRYKDLYVYNNGDSYVPAKYRSSYYIFDITDSSGEIWDGNIVVRKSDNKVMMWWAGQSKPSPL